MIKNPEISAEDKALMAKYSIHSETRTVFHFEGYKYDKLKDALRFAKLAKERQMAPALPTGGVKDGPSTRLSS
ncbi:MAG: hypothetical protein R3E54_03520 [Halioglobus sp.]